MKKVTKRIFDNNDKNDEAIRINKYLSDSGICSRREADSFIEQGKVLIDGKVAVMGSKVLPGQQVSFHGERVKREDKLVLIAFNKPQGVVCTTDKREPDNIVDFIKYGSRIYPIGRLDKDSEGLILLTNNGDIVNKILRAGNNHDKEYIVRVNQPITAAFLKSMAEGVPILDTVTKPCSVEAVDKVTFRIILRQGLNRQIRRMCEYLGYRVVFLQRVRIMNVNLGRLQLGGYRNLTDWELEELKRLIQDSTNLPESDEIDEEMVDVRTFDKNMKRLNHGNSSSKARFKAKNFSTESSNKDSSKKYSDKKDTAKKDSLKKDFSKKDLLKKDASKRDSFNKDSSKRDSSKKDSLKKDSFNKEASKRDSFKKDSFNKDSSKRDSYEKESLKKDQYKKDQYKKDQYKKDQYKKDSFNSESNRNEAKYGRSRGQVYANPQKESQDVKSYTREQKNVSSYKLTNENRGKQTKENFKGTRGSQAMNSAKEQGFSKTQGRKKEFYNGSKKGKN